MRRLLSKSPDARPASARELLTDLGRVYGREVAVETAATLTSYVRAPRLIGLDEHLATLLQAGRAPGAEAVSVEGPEGTGKSRLLREARHQLQLEGRAWIHLRVRRDEEDIVERLARRVLTPHILAALHADDQQELKRGFAWLRRGRRQSPPVDPERSAHQLRRALSRAMLAVFAIRPGVFCVDGVDRLVGESRDAVRGILEVLRESDTVQCFVSGREVPPDMAAVRLETRRLAIEQAERLVAHVLGKQGARFANQIATGARSGLWLEESLRHAVESGGLVRREGEWVASGPPWVERPLDQLLLARMDRVDMEARWLALHMALLDRPASIVGLAELMGLEVRDLASTIQALVRSDLAHPRHDAGRVVYQLQDRFLEPALRSFSGIGIRNAHGRLARWYAKRRGAEDLARAAHHRRAEGNEARASALFLRAARTADGEGRPLRALRLFDSAAPAEPDFAHTLNRADLAERAGATETWSEALGTLQSMRRRFTPEQRVELDLRRVRHALRSGKARTVVRTCRGALRQARALGCSDAESDLLLLAGELEMARGRLDTAERWFRRAAAHASAQGDAVRTARAWQGVSLGAMVRGRMEVALETAQAAQDAARGKRDDVLRSEIQRLLGNTLRGVGRLKAARAAYRKSVRCARRVARLDLEAKSLNNLGTVAQFLGDAVEAEVAFRRSIRLKERIGAKASALLGYNNLGGLLIGLGRFDEAEPELRRAAAQGPEAGLIYSIAVGNLGDLEAARGNLDAAIEHYVEGAADAQRVDNAGQATHALGALTRTLLARGAPGDLEHAVESERELARIAASGVAEGQRRWLTSRAMLSAAQGLGEAVEFARRGVTVQDRATAFADLYGTQLDARWIYTLALHRAGRVSAAKKQYQACRNRLNALARGLPKPARKQFLEAHPLNRAIMRGSFDLPPGRAW